MSLVVTGSIGIDTVYTPDGEHREGVLGGSCSYFAASASFYGPVRVVAAVGEDFPDELHQTLAGFKGVDLQGLEKRAGSATFRWGGKYHENMDSRDTLYTELGVLGEAQPPVPQTYRDSKVVFLANSHPAVQLDMLRQITGRRLAVADTMDLWINTANDELRALMKEIDGLVLNFDEAELFTGKRNTVAAAKQLLELGPSFVVVKKGEHGALFVHRDGIGAIPAFPSEVVVDPTGAGDTFAGGMMGFLAQHADQDHLTSFQTLLKSLAHGTVTASFNIESFSLERLKSLTRDQIDERHAEFVDMLKVH